MSQNRRKQLLLAALVLIAVFYGGDYAYTNWIEKPKEARRNRIALLNSKISEFDQKYIAPAQQTTRWLQYWYSQSLPGNPQIAQSLYRAWLLEVGDYVGLAGRTVSATEPVNRGYYYAMTFSLRGAGTLEQLTEFLYEFYNAIHLHKITAISMAPMGNRGTLNLSITVEALILRGVNRTDRLGSGRAYRLASLRYGDYKVIPQRNLFSVGGGGAADPVSQTYLTAVNYVNDEPQAWFTLRTADAVMKLRVGDRLVQTDQKVRKLCEIDDLQGLSFDGPRSAAGSIGEIESGSVLIYSANRLWEPTLNAAGNAVELRPFDSHFSVIGRVSDIADTEVVLESGEESWLLSIGDGLNDAFALPPELQPSPAE